MIFVDSIFCLWLFHFSSKHSAHQGLSTLAKELTVASRVMQSSSNELSTSVADRNKSKPLKVNIYVLWGI